MHLVSGVVLVVVAKRKKGLGIVDALSLKNRLGPGLCRVFECCAFIFVFVDVFFEFVELSLFVL